MQDFSRTRGGVLTSVMLHAQAQAIDGRCTCIYVNNYIYIFSFYFVFILFYSEFNLLHVVHVCNMKEQPLFSFYNSE